MCLGIPILKNLHAVPANMRLVARHDQVVAIATDREMAKRKADRQAAEAEVDKAQASKAAKTG